MKWFRTSAVILLTAVLLLAACRPFSGTGKLVYGLTLAPSSIDPHVGASSELGIPLTSVYDPLVWLTPEGKYVPGLAERWEVSEEGTVYIFDLRQDVEFHDGTPFDANAVCVNLDRIADPATKSAKAIGLLGPYAGCEAVDDHTAWVSFSSAYAPFLGAVSQVYLAMASPLALQEWGDEYQFHQVGTGPFKFQEYVPKDHLTLVRNDDYDWAPSFFAHQGPAYLQEIEFRFFVDPATRAPALESGDVDIMGEIPPPDADRLNRDPDFQLLEVPVPGEPFQMHVNMAKSPTDDIRVRQALLYAIDQQAIVDAVFMGYSPPAAGPLNRVTWGYDAGVESLYSHDEARAGQLLDEAGWRDTDGDGVRDKDGKPLELETILMGWGLLPEVGQVLQDQYRRVGIQLNTQVLPFPAAVQAAAIGQHHLIPFNFSSSDPHILRTSYYSANVDGGFNWSKVEDAELDALLDRGMQTVDEDARAKIYAEVQQRIMAEAMIVPIRDWVNLNAASARVTGLRYDVQGWFPLLYDVQVE